MFSVGVSTESNTSVQVQVYEESNAIGSVELVKAFEERISSSRSLCEKLQEEVSVILLFFF